MCILLISLNLDPSISYSCHFLFIINREIQRYICGFVTDVCLVIHIEDKMESQICPWLFVLRRLRRCVSKWVNLSLYIMILSIGTCQLYSTHSRTHIPVDIPKLNEPKQIFFKKKNYVGYKKLKMEIISGKVYIGKKKPRLRLIKFME